MIWLIIYFVGVILAAIVMPKLFPYQEGDWELFGGEAHLIDEEQHKSNNAARVMLWPLCLAVLVILLPIKLLYSFCDICYDKFKKL